MHNFKEKIKEAIEKEKLQEGVFDLGRAAVGHMRLSGVNNQIKKSAKKIDKEWSKAKKYTEKKAEKLAGSKYAPMAQHGNEVKQNLSALDRTMMATIEKLNTMAKLGAQDPKSMRKDPSFEGWLRKYDINPVRLSKGPGNEYGRISNEFRVLLQFGIDPMEVHPKDFDRHIKKWLADNSDDPLRDWSKTLRALRRGPEADRVDAQIAAGGGSTAKPKGQSEQMKGVEEYAKTAKTKRQPKKGLAPALSGGDAAKLKAAQNALQRPDLKDEQRKKLEDLIRSLQGEPEPSHEHPAHRGLPTSNVDDPVFDEVEEFIRNQGQTQNQTDTVVDQGYEGGEDPVPQQAKPSLDIKDEIFKQIGDWVAKKVGTGPNTQELARETTKNLLNYLDKKRVDWEDENKRVKALNFVKRETEKAKAKAEAEGRIGNLQKLQAQKQGQKGSFSPRQSVRAPRDFGELPPKQQAQASQQPNRPLRMPKAFGELPDQPPTSSPNQTSGGSQLDGLPDNFNLKNPRAKQTDPYSANPQPEALPPQGDPNREAEVQNRFADLENEEDYDSLVSNLKMSDFFDKSPSGEVQEKEPKNMSLTKAAGIKPKINQDGEIQVGESPSESSTGEGESAIVQAADKTYTPKKKKTSAKKNRPSSRRKSRKKG